MVARRDSQRNRDSLLSAARRVFEAEGIDAPLENIAAAAGLSRTSLHRHFVDRADLVAAIWAADVEQTESDASMLESRPDAFVRLFDLVLLQQVDRRSLHPDAGQLESPAIVELGARFIRALEGALATSRAAGMFRDGTPDTSALRATQMAITAVWSVADRASRYDVFIEVRRLLLLGLLDPDWLSRHPDILDEPPLGELS